MREKGIHFTAKLNECDQSKPLPYVSLQTLTIRATIDLTMADGELSDEQESEAPPPMQAEIAVASFYRQLVLCPGSGLMPTDVPCSGTNKESNLCIKLQLTMTEALRARTKHIDLQSEADNSFMALKLRSDGPCTVQFLVPITNRDAIDSPVRVKFNADKPLLELKFNIPPVKVLGDNDTCAICTETITATTSYLTSCHHVFHSLCIFSHAKSKNALSECPVHCSSHFKQTCLVRCPVCRTSLLL